MRSRGAGRGPVRTFSWRPGQLHRPGLAFMGATGHGHGFESLAERRALTVLEFCGRVRVVLVQPFRLRFGDGSRREHIPDFLVATAGSTLLTDVRPGHLIKEADGLAFTATSHVAAAAGWRYMVVSGWLEGVAETVEVLARGRRPRRDPLGLEGQLLAAAIGASRLAELVAAASRPVPARDCLLRLLWMRRLAFDLNEPLGTPRGFIRWHRDRRRGEPGAAGGGVVRGLSGPGAGRAGAPDGGRGRISQRQPLLGPAG
ncbi:TnsA-like heteromeric transposase endonuclease subunit [Streptomyces tendae]|uniref:TnsA-like heteromeric transposase endonuclease subunit n=1 Tax=Streptomyces tendae TaxID=1932 RepID=UPI003432429E